MLGRAGLEVNTTLKAGPIATLNRETCEQATLASGVTCYFVGKALVLAATRISPFIGSRIDDSGRVVDNSEVI